MKLVRSGTAIEVAHDDDRARTILVSDLHVPRHGGSVLDNFERLLVRAAADRPAETRVLVLGDLFDFYIGPGQLRVGDWGRVSRAIAAAVAAGVSVTVLHGNRDFMLGRSFARRSGCRVVAGGLSFCLGEVRAVALHGDELCWKDLPYLRAKRLLRHPLTRGVLSCLPTALGLRLGRQVRKESQASQASQAAAEDRYEPIAEALTEVFDLGFDLLVFGHIHRPAAGPFGSGEYKILPAFDTAPVYLESVADGLEYRSLESATVPTYGPRSFPSA